MADSDRDAILGQTREVTEITDDGWRFVKAVSSSEVWRCIEGCKNPDVRYVFHHKTQGIYKTCWNCFHMARAVKKKDYQEYLFTGATFDDYNLAREERYRRQWEAKVKEIKAQLAIQDDFYDSREWKRLRYAVLLDHYNKHGHTCLLCRRKEVVLHVDHIKPRSKYPELALDKENLQVLCADCNQGKSNWDETDFRRRLQKGEGA